MGFLLAWTQDDILAARSGYQLLADYLPDSECLILPRRDPTRFLPLLKTRFLRRFSFTRWCVGASFDLEHIVHSRIKAGFSGIIHFPWCDRDLAFLDTSPPSPHLPIIGTFHQPPDQLDAIIRRPRNLSRFAAIILMSETQRPWFLHHGVDPSRLHVILHGVDTAYYTPTSLEPPSVFKVLSVGGTMRDFPQMRQVALSLQDSQEIRFHFIGPPDKASYFQDLPNVSYQSQIADAELLSLYQSASCFLHLPTQATANNAMLEALSCGTPIISQSVGGVPEYLSPACARLSARGDSSTVASMIRQLASSPSEQLSLRAAARSHAESLDWTIIARQTLALYHTLN
jgi:glycosyltransferase involved in cell wall biosynthesis